ncbi:MAG: AAA family ATPase [Amoebophilaceae bacterium]|nr:AAA family ATPase [Amoebophilaceae bacterium]
MSIIFLYAYFSAINKNYFLIILGPPAVGKMTIGQEIAKETGFVLFHNHLVIEALLPLFEFKSDSFKMLQAEFRTRIFETFISSHTKGVVFTMVMNYTSEKGIQDLKRWIDLFEQHAYEIVVVELLSDLATRMKRNTTHNRLKHKASKRNIAYSTNILLQNEKEWSMVSPEGFFTRYRWLKLDNNQMAANEAANVIINYFNLPHPP